MWICVDVFYADEEDAFVNNQYRKSDPSGGPSPDKPGRHTCGFCICRMCANEKIGNEEGTLH